MSLLYTVETPIAGHRPKLWLPDEEMRDYFASCRGGLPEAPLIDWAIHLMGDHEYEKMHFVDVGAHVGTWTIPFALTGAQVTAFEAQRWLYDFLWDSLRENGTRKAVAVRAAVHQYGGMNVIIRGMTKDGGGASCVVWPAEKPVISEEVRTTTLDFELYGEKVDLIKLDAEGAEVDILRGAANIIKENQPRIIFECWQEERGQRIEELFRFLHDELNYATTQVSWVDTWLATPRS